MEVSCTAVCLKYVLKTHQTQTLDLANHVLNVLESRVAEAFRENGIDFLFEPSFPGMICFASTTTAVNAALFLLDALEREQITVAGGYIDFGIGIHLCNVSGGAISELDYRRTQCVAGYSNLRQILLSSPVKEAVDILGETLFHAHGVRELGPYGSTKLYELIQPGRPGTDPKQPPPTPPPHNLPQPPVEFVGRRLFRVGLAGVMTSPGLRILKGYGGIGKTSLALTTLHDMYLTGKLSGGVVVLDCEHLPVLSQMLRNSAQILTKNRLQAESLSVCRDTIQKYINSKFTAFLIENYEVVVDDPAIRKWLKEISRDATVLVTSQCVPTDLEGEVFEIPPLAPEEASVLFEKRAKSAGWSIENSDSDLELEVREVISRICETVGSLPLALEIAAALTPSISLVLLLKYLQEDLTLLKARPDSSVEDRHSGINVSLKRAFDTLSEPACDLAERMSLFPSGASAELISEVMRKDRSSWLSAAKTLVQTSIWQADYSCSPERYFQLTLVRRFTEERLGERRPQYFQTAIQALAKLASEKGKIAHPGNSPLRDTRAALDWLEMEWHNVISCAREVLDAGDSEAVSLFSEAIEPFFRLRGQLKDSKEFYERALTLAQKNADRPRQVSYYRYLGIVNRQLGWWERALEDFRNGYRVSEEVGDVANSRRALNNIGCAHIALGNSVQAEEYLKKSLSTSEGLERGMVLHNLGEALLHQDKIEEALQAHHSSLEISNQERDTLGEILAYNAIGDVYKHQGNIDAAVEYYERSAKLQESIGDNASHAMPYNSLGDIYAGKGNWEQAESMYRRCLRQRESAEDVLGKAITLKKLAEADAAQKRLGTAIQLGKQALVILSQTEDKNTREELQRELRLWSDEEQQASFSSSQ